MPILGSAPRRVSPNKWVTAKGRELSRGGSRYWESRYHMGLADGRGHVKKPEPKFEPNIAPPHKPSFETIVASKKGDKQATRQVRRYSEHQQLTRQAKADVQRQTDINLFSKSLPAVHAANKTINPVAGSVIASLSPTTSAVDLYHAARRGNVPEAGVAALGLLPFPIGKGAKAAKAAKAALEAEKAAALPAEVIPNALAEAGRHQVLGAMGDAKTLNAQKEALRKVERGRRIAASEVAFDQAGGGAAGHAASKAALKGKLPTLEFDNLKDLDVRTMDALFDAVRQHRLLGRYDKLNLREALAKMQRGEAPTPSEIDLIGKAFGHDAGTQAAKIPLGQKLLRTTGEVVNIPRAFMSSADVSAVLRQSLVATVHRPGVAAKNIGPMFRMMFDQKFYDDAMATIEKDPRFFQAVHEDHLKMTDVHNPTMGTREEAYPSQLAERVPVAGHVVRGSSRAYTGFINVMRWHVYTELLELAELDGKLTPKLRRDAAKVANWATGRGELPGKTLESAAPLLNTVFFSPRLMASRFQTFNPFFYAHLDPMARKYAMKAAVKTFLTGMSILGAAAAAGAKVGMDPTSADFGKIRIGKTRLDVWGGHQQWARVAGQIYAGKITSTTTGKSIPLSGGFLGSSRWDVGQRFLEGKFSPPASLVRDWAKQEDFQGKPFSWKKAVVERSYPLMVQDMVDTFHEYGLGAAIGAYGIGAFGIGVQTYGTPTKKSRTRAKPYHDPFESVGGGTYSDPFGSLSGP